MNRRLKSALMLAAIVGAIYAVSGKDRAPVSHATAPPEGETYRLVHAIGNTEKILATHMAERDCRREKKERTKIVTELGVGGSVTCLPESLFK